MRKKYELVIEHIEKLIESERLKQGDKLPSIREISSRFNCSKSTVIRAYQELENKHKIYPVDKSGYYLADKINEIKKESIIDFSELMPDPNLLPYQQFNQCINIAINRYKNNLFNYSDVEGLSSFRKSLVKHFLDYNIYTKEEDIFITSGAQQALNILTQMSFSNDNDTILVEQPTYPLMLQLAKLHHQKIIGIKRDKNGINLDELENIFKNEKIKFFYMMPRFHNPLGSSLSENDKQKIVELAKKYQVYIIEDDYLVDLNHNKKSLPLYYYDLNDKVIYIKSFSKTFMPGIRIGAVILPRLLQSTFIEYKRCDDLSTSVLAQGALEIFINSHMYKKHIEKIKREYQKKIECIKDILKENVNQYIVNIPSNGFVIWFQLKPCIKVNTFIHRMKKKNIIIGDTNKYFIEESQENSFALCVSKLSINEIKEGMTIIMNEFK